jgi:CheY-like chemotaxis protein
MVYGFVKQSKGHITIYSEVGHGTAVKLYLPRSKSLEAGEAPNAPISSPRGTERILLVEDEEQVRVVVADHLTGLGYDVVVAANGPEALAMVRSERAFDLMLTDIIMPGQINGKALADEATALSPSMRMLFMSGYSEDAISTFRILNRGVTLLSKPFRKVDLATAVRRVLDSSY